MDQDEHENVISWDSVRFQELHVITANPLTFVLGFCLAFFNILFCCLKVHLLYLFVCVYCSELDHCKEPRSQQVKLSYSSKDPFLKMPPTEMDTMRLGYDIIVYLGMNMFERRGVLK